MAPSDLRGLFRPSTQNLTAQEVFANRHDEWQATLDSLHAHVAASMRVDDFASPRRNVLVFYGVGGIGKSEFSKRLEAHLTAGSAQWTPVPDGLGRLLPVRIDLSRQAGTGFEDVLLAVRLAVGRLGRSMPAFDLALHRYWDVNHPGDPLEAYLRRSGFLRRLSRSVSLPEQVTKVVEDIAQELTLPSVLGSLTSMTVRKIVAALRERRDRVHALSGCERFPELLAADQDLETFSFFPHLLAWDLSQLSTDHSGTPVVLLDTFEEVGDRSQRDLERLLQRLIWLMPNAFFIITGRNRLEWADPALDGQLDWTGPLWWPSLDVTARTEPRQHLVGYLSANDREQYLRTRLVRNDAPVIPAATRSEIAARSYGLPLYLDLAVMRFLDLLERNSRIPGPEEFRWDFPALVSRVIRDLTPGERVVLRTVSLLDAFTVELATAASGLTHDSAALNLINRPFVSEELDTPGHFRLHDLIRSSIRDADAATDDRWSDRDWRRAARRTFGALGAHLPAPDVRGQRRRLMECLTQGLRLACDYELQLGWLVDAAWQYVVKSVWEPIETPTSDQPTAAMALALTMRAVSRSQRVHRQESVDALQSILDTDLLGAGADDLARFYLAECQRHLGLLDASAANMRVVAAGGGPAASDANRGLAHIARHLGRFPAALAATEALVHDHRYHRALGHLWWLHGDIALACSAYCTARELAITNDDNPGQAALAQASLAMAASFSDPARAGLQIHLACKMLRNVKLVWADTHVLIAELLRDAGAHDDVPQRAEAIEATANEVGLGSSVAYIRLALCFHHALRRDWADLTAARSRLQHVTQNGEYGYLVEISHFFDDTAPPSDHLHAEWIGGANAVADRWRDLIAGRQAALALGESNDPRGQAI